MCVQALLSFQMDSLDVLTNASVTAKIVACGMYMCILRQLTRKSHGESHNESHSESHSESQTESLGLGELTR